MTRMVVDCARLLGERGCTLRIAGEEHEVLRMAMLHLGDAHGEQETGELRERVRRSLAPEVPEPG